MLGFSLVAQAKILKRNYLGMGVRCTIKHGQIVPNTPIIIYSLRYGGFMGTYTEDGYIEREISREGNINKIKYSIHNDEGRFNPKSKQTLQVDVVAILLNDRVRIRDTNYFVTENDSTYILSSDEGIDYLTPYMQDEYFFTHNYYGKPKSMFLHIPKNSLVHMYNRDNNELVFEGKFPAVIMYEKGIQQEAFYFFEL